MTLFDLDALGEHPPTTRHESASVPSVSALESDFPAAALSKIAEHESWRKEVHRPATSTHKWWAKRLGSVFRGILTAAVTEPEGDALGVYSSPARLNGLTVLDPFAGSGITVVEALKLGADVIGWDINPVATLVQRQAVQRWDLSELEHTYKAVEQNCRAEIDRVHRSESGETVLYYFWVAVAACPDCHTATRLFSSHVFSQNAYPKRVPSAQVVCPVCLDVIPGRYDFESLTCRNGHGVSRIGAVTRSMMTCPRGHRSKIIDALGGEIPSYEMFAKLVLGFDGKKRYEPITLFDKELYAECQDLLIKNEPNLSLPLAMLDEGENTRQAIRWGFRNWRQFFNDRQLYSLGLLASTISSLTPETAAREALTALFSGTLEFNNMFCSFKGEGTGAVRHMFSHHILKPERTPLEAHPWGTPESSGSFSSLFRSRLLRAHSYKISPTDQVLMGTEVMRTGGLSLPTEASIVTSWPEKGLPQGAVYLRTGDSSHTDLPDESVDLIITDPPYMDNVHYSELADFFHAWLCKISPFDSYPVDIPTTRKEGEVQSAAPQEFEAAITRVWRESARVLKKNGLLAFTFHQARLSGWVGLMKALASAGLIVTAVQPVKGEMSTSITKNGAEPSNLDAVVVCRRRKTASGSPLPDNPELAAKLAEQRLISLRAAGVEIGIGDIRSVVRGNVLATYTIAPDERSLEELGKTADRLATEAVVCITGQADQTADRD